MNLWKKLKKAVFRKSASVTPPPPPPKEKVIIVNAVNAERVDRMIDSFAESTEVLTTSIANMGTVVAALRDAANTMDDFAMTCKATQKTLQMSVEGDLSGFRQDLAANVNTLDRHAKLIDEHNGRISQWAKKCQEYASMQLKQTARNDGLEKQLSALADRLAVVESAVQALSEREVQRAAAEKIAEAERLEKSEKQEVLEQPELAIGENVERDVEQKAEVEPVKENAKKRRVTRGTRSSHSSDPTYNGRFASYDPEKKSFLFLKTYEQARNDVAVAMKKTSTHTMRITMFEYLVGLSNLYLDNRNRNRNLRGEFTALDLKREFKVLVMNHAGECYLNHWIKNPVHVVDKFNELGFFPKGID